MDHLSRIGIFIEVARQESFAGAARTLGITSSAVSKQVRNLEHELKAKLLNRTTRRVSLTEEGALFYERATRALEDIQEAKEQLNELKTTPHGRLKINVPMAFGNSYLKGPIAQFARHYPEVILDVTFDDRLINIAEEDYDVVIRIGVLEDSSLIARKLAFCPMVVCASPEYLERNGTPQMPEDLARHNVVAYTRNKGAHEWSYKGPDGQKSVIGLKSSFQADNAAMMIEAACEGIGILITPAFYLCDKISNGELVPLLEIYESWPARNLYAIFQSNHYLSTRLRLFVDHIAACCARDFPDAQLK
ncbi:LysR family transcriptional regulator [Emcibacter sp.]|uniref:LysR family transcriptional regulator n=1 Tax=Emcibacter sp. TaxID=1979954 RepID=UPI003A8D15FC